LQMMNMQNTQAAINGGPIMCDDPRINDISQNVNMVRNIL